MRLTFFLGLILTLSLPFSIPTALSAAEPEFPRAPQSLSGSTGLLFTQSADTLPPGKVEVGLGSFHERSSKDPGYTAGEVAPMITFGLPGRLELIARTPYMYRYERADEKRSGLREGSLALKWRFLDRNSQLLLPSMAVALAYHFGAGNKTEPFRTVDSWGIEARLIASDIIETYPSVTDIYQFGIYLDGGIFIRDIGGDFQEKHGRVDLGFLFPLSESREVQLILEGNGTVKSEFLLEESHIGFTAGIRYVTAQIHLTGGIQHRFIKSTSQTESRSSDRFVFLTGYLF